MPVGVNVSAPVLCERACVYMCVTEDIYLYLPVGVGGGWVKEVCACMCACENSCC